MHFPRTVYALRHDATGKIYVGSTSRLWLRITAHINCLKSGTHKVKAMQDDFNAFGGSYTVILLDTIHEWSQRDKEYLWMDSLKTRNPEYGYNGMDRAKPTNIDDRQSFVIPMEAGPERSAVKASIELAEKTQQKGS